MDFCKMLELFFEIHDGAQPQTIITDQQKAIEQAIELMARTEVSIFLTPFT
jgi:hypothetical protein